MSRRGRRKNPFKLKIRKEIVYSVVSILFLICAAIVMLSFTRSSPALSDLYRVLFRAFGWTMLILPSLLISIGLMMMSLKWAIASPNLLLGGLLVFIGSLGVSEAGELGLIISEALGALVGSTGSSIISSATILIGGMIITNTPLEELVVGILKLLDLS